jgi:hypothetical protein
VEETRKRPLILSAAVAEVATEQVAVVLPFLSTLDVLARVDVEDAEAIPLVIDFADALTDADEATDKVA